MKKLIYSTLVAAAVAVALAFVGCANETVDMLPSRGETPPVTGPSAESAAAELADKLENELDETLGLFDDTSKPLSVTVAAAQSLVGQIDQIDLTGVSEEVAEKLANVAEKVANKAITVAGDKLADKKSELVTALNDATSPQDKIAAAQKALAAVEEAVKPKKVTVEPSEWGLIPLDKSTYELKDMYYYDNEPTIYYLTIKADDIPFATSNESPVGRDGYWFGLAIPQGDEFAPATGKNVSGYWHKGDNVLVEGSKGIPISQSEQLTWENNADKKWITRNDKQCWWTYWKFEFADRFGGYIAMKDAADNLLYILLITFEGSKAAPKKVTTGLPEFTPATLADPTISGSAKYKLYEPNSYKLTDMYYMDNDKNTYYVTVNANKLKKHKNGKGTEGYWIGIGIPKEVCTIGDAYEVGWKDGQTQKDTISDNDFDTAKKLDGQGFATDDWDTTKKYLTYWWSWTSNSHEGIFKVGAKTVIVKFNVTNPVDRISIDPSEWGMEAVDKSNGNPSLSNMYYYSDDPTTYYLTLTARDVVKKPAGNKEGNPVAAWVGVRIPVGKYAPEDGSRTTPNGCWLNKDGTYYSPLTWKPNTDADFNNNGYYYCYWMGEYGNGYDGYFGMKDSSGKIIYIVRVTFDVTVAK